LKREKEREDYHVRAVQRALRILNCFNDENPYLGVSEISEMLNIHKSTIHALLITMEDEGFVSKSEKKNKYFLTYKLFRLGNIVSEHISMKSVALPYMENLCKETGESVALNVRDHYKRLVLAVIENPHPLRLFLRTGQLLPLHASAAGKVLMADMNERQIEEAIKVEGLSKQTPNTITDPEELLKELHKVKKQGYATCNGEGYWDAGSVGVPVRDHEGNVIASIIIYGPLQNYRGEQLKKFIRATKDCAEKISHIMGYRG
jgi:DNA-binding IclR family transcriptional regulator